MGMFVTSSCWNKDLIYWYSVTTLQMQVMQKGHKLVLFPFPLDVSVIYHFLNKSVLSLENGVLEPRQVKFLIPQVGAIN